MAHDLTEVRKEALLSLATPNGEAEFVEEAMKVCIHVCMDQPPNLSKHTAPLIAFLSYF
jgi:hypothetical protein